MSFTDQLESLAEKFAQELIANFEIYNTPVIAKTHVEKHQVGYLTHQTVYQSTWVRFDNMRFKFGFDDEIKDWSMRTPNLTIVPNKKTMKGVARATLNEWPLNIPVITTELKLGGVWGIVIPDIGKPRTKVNEKLSNIFFRGPLVRDDCATPEGGSIDFVWYVPAVRIFTDNKTFFNTLDDGIVIA